MREIFFFDDSDALAAKAYVDGQGPNGCGEGVWVLGRPIGLIEAHTCDELENACNSIDQASDRYHVILLVETTARKLYDDTLGKLKANPTIFDVLFFNERDELTEGARSNVFLVKGGMWSAPVVESALLSGVMRQEILDTRKIFEKKLYHEDLVSADALYLSNSLRGLVRVTLADHSP